MTDATFKIDGNLLTIGEAQVEVAQTIREVVEVNGILVGRGDGCTEMHDRGPSTLLRAGRLMQLRRRSEVCSGTFRNVPSHAK